MIRRNPMSRLLARRAMRTVVGLIVLVVVIFIADQFTTLMETALRNGGTALQLAGLLLLKVPEVFDFALPLALMLGLYFAIVAAREENELIVCAASGVHWAKIPQFAITLGVAGAVASLLFSGFVTPLSSYALRLSLYELQATRIIEEIERPGQRSAVRQIEGRVLIASPSPEPDAQRGNLFIYHPETAGLWRVSQADDWTVTGPDDSGGYLLELKRFRDYSGAAAGRLPDPAETGRRGAIPPSLGLSNVSVQAVELAFNIDDLIAAADRARRGNEKLLTELARQAVGDDIGIGQPDPLPRRFGEILARAVLCVLAAAIAVAAAAWSATRSGRYAALPCAGVGVMLADIALRTMLGDVALHGAVALTLGVAAALLAGLGPLALYLRNRGELIIAPARNRK